VTPKFYIQFSEKVQDWRNRSPQSKTSSNSTGTLVFFPFRTIG